MHKHNVIFTRGSRMLRAY